jgi:6-phosphofructokinase 1
VTVLGHVQRGSQPTYNDRLLATAFGVKAVELVAEGKFDKMVAWQNREVVDVPIEQAIAAYKEVNLDDTMVKTARGIGISFGDEAKG